MEETILHQTLVFLSDVGLKFTMSDLAKSLSMSKKTLYQIYPSKQDLLLEVVEAAFQQIKQEEEAILATDLDLADKLKRLLIVMPDSYYSLNWSRVEELADKYPAIYQRIQDHLESDWDPTLDLVKQGIDQGLFRDISPYVFKGVVEGAMEHFLRSKSWQAQGIDYLTALDQLALLLVSGLEK